MPSRPSPDERKPAPAAPSSITGTRTGAHRALARVGTEEFHSMRLPPAQEAAVLYSANHADAAVALLRAEIRETTGKGNKQAWLMLFDLYQAGSNRAATSTPLMRLGNSVGSSATWTRCAKRISFSSRTSFERIVS